MNNLHLIITDEAFDDIDKIADFIAEYNPRAARETIEFLLGACNNLLKFPSLGVKKNCIKSNDVRFYIIRQYLIAYRIHNNRVVILKISNRYQDIYPNL